MIWGLFIAFLKIGFVSFGGGYAVIPLIQHESETHSWLSDAAFQEAVSIAGMSPGPIATNAATLIGYRTAGIPGAILSTLGISLPSLLIIILIASLFFRIHHNRFFRSSFYGLRPVVTGMIVYAAIHFLLPKEGISYSYWTVAASLLIAAASLYAILRFKWHPLAVIVASALAGIILF